MTSVRIYMRFPNQRSKAVTLSYDDGSEQDVRLMEIMNRHGIKGTFNISAGLYSPEGKQFPEGSVCRRMTRQAAIDLYKDSGHEVAIHGYSHPFLEQMPSSRIALEALEDRVNHERDFGCIVRGMAYPFGSFDQTVIDALKSAGIVYSRTTTATGKFSVPTDWYRWNPTCKHTDSRLKELTGNFLAAKGEKTPMLFYLWGHSFEFDSDHNWDVIERFCAEIGGREDVWYATNLEIYDYVQAYQRLIWSADAGRVYNPSSIPVSFKLHVIRPEEETHQTYTVAPNEMLELF